MLPSRFLAQVAVSFLLVLRANAETHVIKFVNQCGFGSPALMFDGENILNGDTYTSNGNYSGIAYLQTGYCNVNGENCTLLETTLINSVCAGCGSSTDLSLIPPHAYSVETSFAYYNGCDGMGKTCSSPDCTDAAFFNPNDNFVQVACETDNVNLLVAFCADAAQLVTGNATTTSGGSSPTSSPATPSSTPSLVPSSPTSSPPTSSNTPSLVPSSPGSVPLPTLSGTPSAPGSVVPPTYTPTPTAPGTTTPSSTPIATPSGSGSDSGCGDPGETTTPSSAPPSTPASAQTPPTTSPSVSPATCRRCRPRPTGQNALVSPSSPADTSTPTFSPSVTPSTNPATTPSGTPDTCGGISTPSQAPTSAQRRRHRRTNRVRY